MHALGAALEKRLGQFYGAWSLLTRLPFPVQISLLPSPPPQLNETIWAFPLVGAVIGAASAAAYFAALALNLPQSLAGLTALAAGVLITGALHEDGLADSADGFWGGTTPERRLQIMRDSRIGSFGVLALIFSVAARATPLAVLPPQQMISILIIQHAMARAAISLPLYLFPPARPDGLAANAGRPSRWQVVITLAIGGAILLPLLPTTLKALGLLLFLAASFSAIAVGWLACRKINGITGDSLGAAEQLAELAILWTFAATMVQN